MNRGEAIKDLFEDLQKAAEKHRNNMTCSTFADCLLSFSSGLMFFSAPNREEALIRIERSLESGELYYQELEKKIRQLQEGNDGQMDLH